MNRIHRLTLLLFLASGGALHAQDIITLTDGADIPAIVTEVGDDQVLYKIPDDPEGETYALDVRDILMITYEDGERDLFNTGAGTASLPHGQMLAYKDGKVYVGGLEIDSDALGDYLNAAELKTFQSDGLLDGALPLEARPKMGRLPLTTTLPKAWPLWEEFSWARESSKISLETAFPNRPLKTTTRRMLAEAWHCASGQLPMASVWPFPSS